MATIWLHFFLQNKNCSQEIVESSFRVRVDYCDSKYYVELCSRTTEWFIAISGYNSRQPWLQILSVWLHQIPKTMMKSIFRVVFYLRSNYVNKEGKTSVMLRIYLNNERLSLGSTGIKPRNDFDSNEEYKENSLRWLIAQTSVSFLEYASQYIRLHHRYLTSKLPI